MLESLSTGFAREHGGKMDKKKYEYLAGKIAPTQKEYRSKAAKNGERISPTWMPDDIGTENFDKSSGTAYLRKIK